MNAPFSDISLKTCLLLHVCLRLTAPNGMTPARDMSAHAPASGTRLFSGAFGVRNSNPSRGQHCSKAKARSGPRNRFINRVRRGISNGTATLFYFNPQPQSCANLKSRWGATQPERIGLVRKTPLSNFISKPVLWKLGYHDGDPQNGFITQRASREALLVQPDRSSFLAARVLFER